MKDSLFTLAEALLDNPSFPCPKEIREMLVVIEVPYFSFEGTRRQGQLVVHQELAEDIKYIFKALAEKQFPLSKVIPIAGKQYEWDDERSMQDDNTSCFNYRTIAGTDRISWHAYGRAIDINPKRNPYIKNGVTSPKGALYDSSVPGTITSDSFVVTLFKERGFEWGGDWTDRKDYQHFEKHF
ncbi:MAG: M15 family metallopeptidase [Patescibacteria group bacterium]